MKIFIIILSLLFGLSCFAEDVHLLAKIKSVNHKIEVTKDGQATPVLFKLKSQDLEKSIKNLRPEDEALLIGELNYESVGKDSKKLEPIFLIKEIHPVSLERLGLKEYQIQDPKVVFKSFEPENQPKSIKVSPEIATTLVLTGSILLLRSNSNTQVEAPFRSTIQNSLIFSAGALATGLFIWDQIKLKKK
ncbi:MAG: hypothetical protein AB7I27_16925 [Bacteriovoracaceae bacterium]